MYNVYLILFKIKYSLLTDYPDKDRRERNIYP
nr:MAG TPA: hypothetical protein [Caudoviricetes sp.]